MPGEPIVIVGAGDHGRVVLELLRAAGAQVAGFVEPAARREPGEHIVDGLRVLGDLETDTAWLGGTSYRFVAALGDNRGRAEAYSRARAMGLEPVAAVHPTATVLTGATIEPGATICAAAVIGVAATVAANAIVNTAASVDHDNRIGPHATVAPGAHLAGRVSVGEGAFVGIGASVREGVTIGDWAFVAGGAMVVDDVAADARVAGVPARVMRE